MSLLAGILNAVCVILWVAVLARAILSFVIPAIGSISPNAPRFLKDGFRFMLAVNDTAILVTEPLLAPIRRVLPTFGGLDFSPMALIIILIVVQNLIISRL